MGHEAPLVKKKVGDVERHMRYKRRRESTSAQEDVSLQLEEAGYFEEEHTGISTQTDLTMEELSLKFSQSSFASKKIEQLEKKIEVSPFGLLENQ
ncbi:unnamed protein product, partial [Callosobruchus maculatus]